MGKQILLKVLIPILLLVAFLVGTMVFDRAQTAREQAYLATATVYIPPATTAVPPTTVPTKASAFSVVDEAGKVYTWEDFAGKPTVLCFWSAGSAEAKRELPTWDGILEEYGDDINLVVIHVNDEKTGMQAALACLKEERLSFTPYFDLSGDAARAYDIGIYPTAFFINAQGQVKARARGNISASNLPVALERIGLTED